MCRNKQYDAKTDGNISLKTADTLQRHAANDAPNWQGAYAYIFVFSWKWNVRYLKWLLNIQEPRNEK